MYSSNLLNGCEITTVKLHQYMIAHYPLSVRVTRAASLCTLLRKGSKHREHGWSVGQRSNYLHELRAITVIQKVKSE
jgi:hypothetical protein